MSAKSSTLTPMLQQYQRLKEQSPDALLMFRLGDFYELFGDDAVLAAPILEVQLTSRDGVVPMCGVPYHAIETYLRKLMAAGHTVAIAEQMEDPRQAKGLVERQVTRICSPGTYIPDDSWDIPRLAAIVHDREGWALAVAELATGTIHLTEMPGHRHEPLLEEWNRWHPDEYLTNWTELSGMLSGRPADPGPWFPARNENVERELANRLGTQTMTAWGLSGRIRSWHALYAVFRYLEHSQRRSLPHLKSIQTYEVESGLRIPDRSLRQIGVFATQGPSLYQWLNRTATPMGSRLLEQWLRRPLADREAIDERAERIVRWVHHPIERGVVRQQLRTAGDIPKRLARLALGLGTPKDLRQIGAGIELAQSLLPIVRTVAGQWTGPDPKWPQLNALQSRLAELVPDPPIKWDEGGLFHDGVDAGIDRLRQLVSHRKEALAQLEQEERDRTQLRSLKIGYHRAFGYYWEVSRTQAEAVPSDWRRRQTMTNRERYTSDALLALEAELLGAEEERWLQEKARGEALRSAVQELAGDVNKMAEGLAQLDVLCALAEVAALSGYVWPDFEAEGETLIKVEGLRHPVLETLLADYVSSDFELPATGRLAIITGPNMGGKSTFMRALAQAIILAQIGMGIPARRASLPILDGIFTRIGADDDLYRGQSTFMVEMEELSAILRAAGPKSLIILDELGRGTSTYDGMAIAHAVVEHLAQTTGPITLFATHFQELTNLAERFSAIQNWTVEVLVQHPTAGPIFTHRLIPGAASRSYGVEVARLAGLPAPLLARARTLLTRWESGGTVVRPPVEQVTLFQPDPVAQEIVTTLQEWDPDELSPKEAWQWIWQWHQRLKETE